MRFVLCWESFGNNQRCRLFTVERVTVVVHELYIYDPEMNNSVGHPLPHSSLWKRVIAWERSRAASAYGIIWGDAGQNKHGGI